jgi:hypothetical protein
MCRDDQPACAPPQAKSFDLQVRVEADLALLDLAPRISRSAGTRSGSLSRRPYRAASQSWPATAWWRAVRGYRKTR